MRRLAANRERTVATTLRSEDHTSRRGDDCRHGGRLPHRWGRRLLSSRRRLYSCPAANLVLRVHQLLPDLPARAWTLDRTPYTARARPDKPLRLDRVCARAV